MSDKEKAETIIKNHFIHSPQTQKLLLEFVIKEPDLITKQVALQGEKT